MTDQRFEDWWARSPARVALSPAAKEVARGVWQAARDDLVGELNGGAAAEMTDAWRSELQKSLGIVMGTFTAHDVVFVKVPPC